MTPRPFVSGLLLAAGTSSRFGRVKQLAELDGTALVERSVKMLEDADVDEVVVVLGHAAPEVRSRLDGASAKIVLNTNFRTGLGSSLRLGVESLDRKSKAVVVCLSDQPFVTSELVNRIVARFRETGMDAIAASAGGVVSPPVLIGRKLYSEVGELSGDKGAKSIVMGQPKLEIVEVEEEALLDVDTEEQLAKAREILRARTRTEKAQGGDVPSRGRLSSKR